MTNIKDDSEVGLIWQEFDGLKYMSLRGLEWFTPELILETKLSPGLFLKERSDLIASFGSGHEFLTGSKHTPDRMKHISRRILSRVFLDRWVWADWNNKFSYKNDVSCWMEVKSNSKILAFDCLGLRFGWSNELIFELELNCTQEDEEDESEAELEEEELRRSISSSSIRWRTWWWHEERFAFPFVSSLEHLLLLIPLTSWSLDGVPFIRIIIFSFPSRFSFPHFPPL